MNHILQHTIVKYQDLKSHDAYRALFKETQTICHAPDLSLPDGQKKETYNVLRMIKRVRLVSVGKIYEFTISSTLKISRLPHMIVNEFNGIYNVIKNISFETISNCEELSTC